MTAALARRRPLATGRDSILDFDVPAPDGGTISARSHGPIDAPAVLVLGGISADRRVCAGPSERGWWPALTGSGGPLDPARLRILSFDYWIGRPGHCVLPADQADIVCRLLDSLGIERLPLLAGASYGGMVGLSLAARHPGRLGRLLVVSGAHRPHPLATAWRAIQRRIVRLGLEHDAAEDALVLARALAMTTYRTAEEFASRFDSSPQPSAHGPLFAAERYVTARGEDFVARVSPGRFLALSESIDLQAVDPAAIATPATLIAIRQDQLVPLAQMRELAAGYAGVCELHEIDSIYGHDAFLKEREKLTPIFQRAIRAATENEHV